MYNEDWEFFAPLREQEEDDDEEFLDDMTSGCMNDSV